MAAGYLQHATSPLGPPTQEKHSKPTKDVDTASIRSTSTFASTVGLIKSKLSKTRKETGARKPEKKQWTDSKSPRARTAEAYMVMAMTRH
ncbi:hypothetical protein LSUE1_G000728 [Lachnellula suecica]|uniref:Uncharacterized protein n=1 Tax=Lachnellula suecica TaxID=602035 RepID=A0A8T9CDB7_9HELO|nr:hypothetical protein LSUE1_G000728 [Lachnellula suecica]